MADSDIVLGIDFDISNVKRTAQDIQKELNNGLKSGGGESPALKAIEAQIDNLSQKVSELSGAIKQITGQQGMGASTEAVEGLNSTVQSLIDTLINLAETPAVDPIDIEEVEESTDEMVDTVVDGVDEAINNAGTMLSTFLGSFFGNLISHFVVEVVKSAIRLIMNKIKEAVHEVKEIVEGICEYTVKIIQGVFKTIGKLMNVTLKGFFNLGTTAIGSVIKGVQILINKLMSLKPVIIENLKLMAKWRHGNNAVNKALSNLTSSLAYLKGALAASIAPILISIEPMLTRIIGRLAELVNIIGMLIAKMTGASTFQKAIRKQKDFAKALNATAGAATKTLAPFDELNVLTEKNGDAVDWAVMELEDFELPDWLSDLYELGTTLGLKIKKFFDNIPWDSIQAGAKKAAQGISDFINGILSVRDLGSSIGTAFGEAINTITTFVNTLLTKIHFDKLGQQFGDAIIEGIRAINWSDLGSVWSNAINSLVDFLIGALGAKGHSKSNDGSSLGTVVGKALSELIASAFRNIEWTDIYVAIHLFFTNLADALKSLLTPETFITLGDAFAKTINAVFFGADSFTHSVGKEGFNQFGSGLADGINEAVHKINAAEGGRTVSDLASGLLDMLLAAIDGLYDNIDEITDKIVGFLASINWEDLGGKISEISDKLMDAFEKIWQELKDSGTLDRIIDFIVEVLNDKEAWEKAFKKIKRELFFEYLFEKGLKWSEGNRQKVIEWFNNIGKNIIFGIFAGFKTGMGDIGKAVQKFFEALWSAFCERFLIESPSKAMEPIGENIILGILQGFGLVDFITEVTTWWNNNVQPWFDSIQEKTAVLKEGLELKMDAIRDKIIDTVKEIKKKIKTPLQGILNFFGSMINGIIDAINALIGKLSGLKFDVPDNPVLFGALAGTKFDLSNLTQLSHIDVPQLATGGVIPPSMSEHLAMLGDNNHETEVVSPLSTMKDALLEALAEVGINGQPINIYLGTKQIYSEIKKLEKRDVVMGG